MKIIKIATISMIAVGSLAISSSSLAEIEHAANNKIDSTQYTVEEERVLSQQKESEIKAQEDQVKKEIEAQQDQVNKESDSKVKVEEKAETVAEMQQNQLKNEVETEAPKEQTKQENVIQQEQPSKVQAAPNSFPDVPGWVKPSVDYLINKNVLSGMPDGTFSPNLEIDRGSLSIMAKILNLSIDQSEKPSFDDSKKALGSSVYCGYRKSGCY